MVTDPGLFLVTVGFDFELTIHISEYGNFLRAKHIFFQNKNLNLEGMIMLNGDFFFVFSKDRLNSD